MPLQPIPLTASQVTSGSELAGAQPLAVNVVMDAAGAVRRRPGLSVYSKGPAVAVAGTGIEALTVDLQGRVYAVTAPPRRLYLLSASGASVRPGAAIPGSAGFRTQVAVTGGMFAFAAGGAMQKFLFTTEQVSPMGGSPPVATHVIAQGARLLANNTAFPDQFAYSGTATGGATAGHEDWTIGTGLGGFVSAEARPDPIVAVHENTNEVFTFGAETLQVWSTDPSTQYAPGSTREHGCVAPYSVIKRDQSFAWLDHRRRFVVSDGRAVEPIGDAVQSQVDAMATVSDCYGFRLRTGHTDALVWVFPSEGVTLAFAGGWSQWASYDDTNDAFLNLKFSAAVINPFDGAQVVGTTESRVGRFDQSANTDLGETIKAEIRTGAVSRGSGQRKVCRAVYVTIRGEPPSTAGAPVGWLSWREVPNGRWGRVPVRFNRGNVIRLPSLGFYRHRQWRWEFAEDYDLELVSIEEDYEIGAL